MTAHSTHAVLPLALVAGTLVLTVAACGGDGPPTPAPTAPTPVTTSSSSAASSSAASVSSSPTPSSTSASPGTGGTTCAVGSLKISYANDTGGGGAGSVSGALTFTNTGSTACTLRGFPGVSFVRGAAGTQVGQPATRTDGAVKTKTVAPGRSVKAALRRTQPGNYGDDCQQTKVDGFRVYPPDSTESAFVAFTTTGCKNASVPLLQVGPVA
jgi:hypothetical protein